MKMDDRLRTIVLFAAEVIDGCWADGGPNEDQQMILDYATEVGIVHWRKPTNEELADDEWWGHGFDIGPDSADVGDITPEYRAIFKEAKAAKAA